MVHSRLRNSMSPMFSFIYFAIVKLKFFYTIMSLYKYVYLWQIAGTSKIQFILIIYSPVKSNQFYQYILCLCLLFLRICTCSKTFRIERERESRSELSKRYNGQNTNFLLPIGHRLLNILKQLKYWWHYNWFHCCENLLVIFPRSSYKFK